MSRISPRQRFFAYLIAVALLIVVIGASTASLAVYREKESLERDVAELTHDLASTLQPDLLERLPTSNTPHDDSLAYQQLQRQLSPILSLSRIISGIGLVKLESNRESPDTLLWLRKNDSPAPDSALIQRMLIPENDLSSDLRSIHYHDDQDFYFGRYILTPGKNTPNNVIIFITVDTKVLYAHAIHVATVPILLTLLLIIGLPLGLLYRNRRKMRLRAGESLPPAIDASFATFIGLVLSFGLYWYLDHNYRSYIDKDLEARANSVEREITQNLYDAGKLGNQAIVSFFRSANDIRHQDFSTFAGHLKNFTSIEGWGWIVPVLPSERESFSQRVRENLHIEDFQIWEHSPEGQPVAAQEREIHYPLVFVAPDSTRRTMQGFDFASDPERSAAISQALNSKSPWASSFTSLLHNDNRPSGILILHPAFDGRNHPNPVGIAVAAVSVDEMLSGTTPLADHIHVDFYEAGTDSQWEVIRSNCQHNFDNLSHHPLRQIHPLLIFGKTYALVIHPENPYLNSDYIHPGWIGLIFGLVLTGVITITIALQGKNRRDLENAVAQRTRELAESERKYRLITDNATDIIWVYDPEIDQFLFVSSSATTITGFPIEEILQKPLRDIIHSESLSWVDDSIRLALNDYRSGLHKTYTDIVKLNHKDGYSIFAEVTYQLSRNPYTGRLELSGAARDATERIEHDEHLNLLAKALDAANNMILIFDDQGIIRWSNQAFSDITGFTREEAIGMSPNDFICPESANSNYISEIWETIRSGETWSGEVTKRRKDGTPYPEELTVTPVRNESGQITHFISIKRDLTQEKAQEQGHLRAQRLESIGFLAGGIAHDLNNALAPILMSIDLLRRNALSPEDRQEILDSIEASARRSARMVSQVLDFARGVEVSKCALSPSQLGRELRSFIGDTIPKNINFTVDVKTDEPIHGDSTQLHQVFVNICLNAIDAMPNGGSLRVIFDLANRDDLRKAPELKHDGTQYLKITFQDTGSGIHPDLLEKIFDPFFTTKEVGKGSGLGLSTAHSLVQSHQGFIRVSSTLGVGTAFTVFLPATNRQSTHPSDSQLTDTPPPAPNTFVLIVDDEPLVLNSLKMVLEKEGYCVFTAGNGSEAISVYRENKQKISLVISDIAMPIMDGVTASRIIRRINPDIPIILASGHPGNHQNIDLASAFLPKPYSPADVLLLIRRLIAKP